MKKALAVSYRPVNDLTPYAKNSRTHSERQVEQIAASIKEFGFTQPILVDGKNGVIAGHGRLMAAKSIGMEEVPVIELSGLTAAQKRAYVIADNKLTENGGWDESILAEELKALGAEGFDLALTGFDDLKLVSFLADKTEGLTDEDDVPDAPAQPVTVEGDVWLMGNHRLRCGDSTSIEAVLLLMDGSTASLVFTDPPYGVQYQSNMRVRSAKFDVLKNDDVLLPIDGVISAVSSGWVFVWTSWKVQSRWIDHMQEFGEPTNVIIWHKPGGGIGDLKKTFASDYEVALVWHRGAELCGKRIGSVWTINKDGAATYAHPTQKPVALAEEAIDKTTRPSAIVLDLFGGSGSTMIACEKTSRHCRMMELDPRYCDVIVSRWQAFTGRSATLEGDGRTFDEIRAERIKDAA